MSLSIMPATLAPILLLVVSNVFMTFAWYGHLKYKAAPLWAAVLVSWGIAFFEYCLAVPANRIGSAVYTAAELKTLQEVITLGVFAGFSVVYLNEPLGWNHAVGFFPDRGRRILHLFGTVTGDSACPTFATDACASAARASGGAGE
jgi:uncharacterized protein